MSDKAPVPQTKFSADWFMRGALTRIGDTIDRLTGRKWTPSSSLATSELIERLKKLLDAEARQIEGRGMVVPHNIKLKMQWDKFSTDADLSLKRLEDELLIAAADHINDSLYYTRAPLTVKVAPDYFTEGVKLYVSFDEVDREENEVELNVTMPAIDIKKSVSSKPAAVTLFIARFTIMGVKTEKRLDFDAGGRLTVGRGSGSDLFLDDVSVSKIHAALVVGDDGDLRVADTGSTNGTFINSQRIAYGEATRITGEDKVRFGTVEVEFERIMDALPDSDITEKRETTSVGDMEFSNRPATEASQRQPIDKTLEMPTVDDPADVNSDNGADTTK